MALEESRFFDYTENDDPSVAREYQADEFAEFFRTFLTDGVPVLGSNLEVTAAETGLQVRVNYGAAFVQGYGYWLTDDSSGVKTLPITNEQNSSLSRIDRVVLRLNKNVNGRSIILAIKSGVSSDAPIAPDLKRDEGIYELSLAKIRIQSGMQNLTAESITDERADRSVCGLIEPISVRNHIDQGVKTTDSPTFNVVTASKVIGAVYQ